LKLIIVRRVKYFVALAGSYTHLEISVTIERLNQWFSTGEEFLADKL